MQWWQWLAFAILAVIAMVAFRKRAYRYLRKPVDFVPDALTIGDHVQLPQSLLPGDTCRVEYRGTSWSARNIDQQSLSGEVVITRIEGLTLLVRQSH